MSNAILGKKIGTTQIFDESGNRVPVTVVEAGPCVVVQKRNQVKHAYSAIQIGFEEIPGRKLSKPGRGVFESVKLAPMRFLREVRLSPEEVEACKVGDKITVSIFTGGDKVDVTGTSKGRGFQGVVKRYGFKGNTKTRGTHEVRRHPGGIGMCQFPGHILKGKKLPGQMGNKRVTTHNLRVVKVDEERNLLLIRGAVPGAANGLVMVRKAIKTRSPKA
jgi:large subunit ribosomal protein L3